MLNQQKRSARKGLSFGSLEHANLKRYIESVELKVASDNQVEVTEPLSAPLPAQSSAPSPTQSPGAPSPGAQSVPNSAPQAAPQVAPENCHVSAPVAPLERAGRHSQADDSDASSRTRQSIGPKPTGRTEFGNYKLIWEHSRDALSTSYVAQRDGIDGTFLIRIYNARSVNAIQLRMIQQAAKQSSSLTHPNHITVYENGVSEDGEPYVVTDYVEGESLAQLFPVVKRLNIARFLHIFNQVCDVLQEAHSHQLIHANLCPSKILLASEQLDEDIVKVVDFGLPPDPVQNAFYLSPEQALDRAKIDARTDIYSLGCIMYEALCGSPPFVGSKVSSASLNYLHELANQYSPDAPEHNALKLLDCIIVKCLQKKPSKRFRNIHELTDALRFVNDCICGDSRKKLPRKAEKLLLFRFLDYFDRKIFVCLFAYLLLGLCSVKFISELQLQKEIDLAQLASINGDAESACDHWNKAIWQATVSSKPAGLLADMQWELANSKQRLCWKWKLDAKQRNSASQNALAKEAIGNYEQALRYFRHGDNSRSSAILLLNNIAGLWNFISVNDHDETPAQRRDAAKVALERVRTLYNKKQYKECTDAVRQYMLEHKLYGSFRYDNFSDLADNKRIAYYAACAFNELGRFQDPAQGIREFEKAYLYFRLSGHEDRGLINLKTCYSKLGADMGEAYSNLYAHRAIQHGDWEAALGEVARLPFRQFDFDENIKLAFEELDAARQEVLVASPKEITPLLEALSIEEKAYGSHSEHLCSTLSQLARCFNHAGDTVTAKRYYERLFENVPNLASYSSAGIGVHPGESNNQFSSDLLEYVRLLSNDGEKKKALALLEKFHLDQFDIQQNRAYCQGNNATFLTLIKLYQDLHMTEQVKKSTELFVGEEPTIATGEGNESADENVSSAGNLYYPRGNDEFESN